MSAQRRYLAMASRITSERVGGGPEVDKDRMIRAVTVLTDLAEADLRHARQRELVHKDATIERNHAGQMRALADMIESIIDVERVDAGAYLHEATLRYVEALLVYG